MDRIQAYIEEDAPRGDVTSETVVDDREVQAYITVKEQAVAACLDEVESFLKSRGITVLPLVKDGDQVPAGTRVMVLKGGALKILLYERVILNILMRTFGIATKTRRVVERCRKVNPDIVIACTRKTTPGFRYFEKKAVFLGGGDPHRYSLSDAVLIKDNHLFMAESLEDAVRRARGCVFNHTEVPEFAKTSFAFEKVEVEAESAEDALRAAGAGADIVMLDNFTPEEAEHAYRELKARYPDVIVEVSGGITEENAHLYARAADVISMGSLTHSYRSVDMSLEMDHAVDI